MMERLTNGIEYCKLHCDFGKSNECFFSNKDKCYERSIYNRLKDYEVAEEQGLLLRLPCKVGDIVYAIDGKNIQTLKAKNDIALISGKLCIFAENCHYADYICYDYIGKTVFLTKSEVEQKLNEIETNNDLA